MDKLNWTEKYRPRTLSQVVGHPTAINQLSDWAEEWKYGTPKTKAIALHGRAGVGKCCRGNTLILTDRGLIKIEDIVHKQIDFSNRNIDREQSDLYDSIYNDNDDEIDEILKDVLKDGDNIKNINNVMSISSKLNYEKYKIIDRYDMGENDVITIKTRLGLEISGTPEHRIIVIDYNGKLRFKKLQDISVSDYISISYNTNIFNEKLKLNFFYRRKSQDYSSQILKNINYMNSDMARLLGYIISEANACFNTSGDVATFTITTYDREMQNDIINICDNIGADTSYWYDKRKDNENPVGIRIHSVAFGNLIYYLGYRHLAQNKEVPWSILQADKDSHISFIRALFDGDGTVGLGDEDDNPYIEYNSSSYELCRQLQIMLLNFGIIGRLYGKKGAKLEYRGEIREYEESYRLHIQGGEILKFAEIISFGLSRKKEILNRCIEILENRKRWTDITFPNIGKVINRLYEELKILGQNGKIIKEWQEDFIIDNKTVKLNRRKAINCKEYLKNDQSLIYQYATGKRQPSIYGLKRMLSSMEYVSYLSEYKYLEMLSNQFIFDNVVTTKNEKAKVYDVTIDDVHSYIGNSIINHNTSCAYALANDMKWEVIELNASDQRTAKVIEKIAGSASKMGSLSGFKKLIIIDEADNIHGTSDRGGEKSVIQLIKETNQPIILTANNFYDMSIGLRNATKPIQFKSISTSTIISVLRQIANTENIICVPGVFEKIADKAEGDLRGAINDLEAISIGKVKLEITDITTGGRDIQENIFKVLTTIFKGKDIKDAYLSTFTIDQNPEDLINWIDENLPLEYAKLEDLAKGYDYLSKASVFLGRVRRRQNYGMWKYASILMTSGMVIAKSVENKMYVKYQSPTFWKELGQKKRFRNIRDSAAKKIGEKCHLSMSGVKTELFPFFRILMNDEKYALHIATYFDLSTDEIEFLTGYDPKIIQKIYDEAQAIIKKEKETDVELFGRFGKSFIEEQQRIEKEKQKEKNVQIQEDKKDKGQSSLFDY